MDTTTQKQHDAEVFALVGVFQIGFGIEPTQGKQYTAECRFGTEGPANWSRWHFEATPELIAEARSEFLK